MKHDPPQTPAAADPSINSGQDLRAQAEAAFREKAAATPQDPTPLPLEATRTLLYELQVQQIQLEMQNEELRRVQAELDVSHARYFDLYDLAPVGYCTVSETGLILEANLTLATLLGVARGALVSQPFARFILKPDANEFYLLAKQLLAPHSTDSPQAAEPPSLELRMVKPDSSHIWVQLVAKVTPDENGAPVIRLTVIDITARRQTAAQTQELLDESERARAALASILEDQREVEVALRESEEKFAKAFRDSPVGMAIRDLATGEYLDANDRCLAMTGYSREEVIGRSPLEIGWMTEADYDENRQLMTAPVGVIERELRLRHKDGRLIVCAYTSHEVRIGGRPCLLSITLDITARKEAEAAREMLARNLELKNRELENLVYVTSHDLRSPMLNIQGFSQRIGDFCAELSRLLVAEPWSDADRASLAAITTKELPKALAYVLTSVEKMDRLIGGLLRLSRVGRAGLKHEPLDLNAIFREIVGTLTFSIQATGAVVEVGALPRCCGDAGQVNQLFTNLLDNALKYRDPARPLRVTVSGWVEGRRAVYCVADTGVGIAAKHHDKIWEIFFQANPGGPAGGEGLGLNLVHRIVERHQGAIWVESTFGEGSRFFVALPVAAANDPAQALREAQPTGDHEKGLSVLTPER